MSAIQLDSSSIPTDSAGLPSRAGAARTPGRVWTGRVLSGLVVAFLAFDAACKLAVHPMAVQGTMELGYPAHVVVPLGVILLACVILYVIPRSSVVGAVLLTGYLGGAVATHVRVGSPLATHTLSPLYFAVLIWGGLALRDARVRALLENRPTDR